MAPPAAAIASAQQQQQQQQPSSGSPVDATTTTTTIPQMWSVVGEIHHHESSSSSASPDGVPTLVQEEEGKAGGSKEKEEGEEEAKEKNAVEEKLSQIDYSVLASRMETKETIDLVKKDIRTILEALHVYKMRREYENVYLTVRKNEAEDLDKLSQVASAYGGGGGSGAPADRRTTAAVVVVEQMMEDPLSISELYALAADAQEEFRDFILTKVKALLFLPSSSSSSSSSCFSTSAVDDDESKRRIMVPPGMKDIIRARFKQENDYSGRASRLLDILRCSIVCDSIQSIISVLDALTRAGGEIRLVKNGFVNDYAPCGYRDVKALVALPKSQFIVEVQIHIKPLKAVKDRGGHAAYKWARMQAITTEMDAFDFLSTADDYHRRFHLILDVARANQPLLISLYLLILFKLEEYEEAANVMISSHYVNLSNCSPNDARAIRVNWSMILINHFSRYAEAEAILAEELDRCEARLGMEHPDTLLVQNNLALALSEQEGRYGEAERMFRDCHRLSIRVLGESHPHSLSTAINLALTLKSLGEFREAVRVLERVVAVVSSSSVGTELEAAHDRATRALNFMPSPPAPPTSPPTSPHTASTERRLAALMNDYDGCVRRYGEFHPDAISVRSAIGGLYIDEMSDYQRGKEIFFDTWQRLLSRFGGQHRDTILQMKNYGGVLLLGKEYEQALVVLKDCEKLLKKRLGQDHSETKDCQLMLGVAMMRVMLGKK